MKLRKRKKYEVFKANKNLQFLYEKSIEQRLWKKNLACKWLKTSLFIILAVSNWYGILIVPVNFKYYRLFVIYIYNTSITV